MKWCVVGYGFEESRYSFLSDWMKKQGVENTLELVEMSPTDFTDEFHGLKEKFDQIRIEKPFRHEAFLETRKNEAGMILLKSADCFYKDSKGDWWLRSPLYEGIKNILNREKTSLKVDNSALIVGVGGASRAAIAALVKVGFQTFNITNAFDDQATELITELRRMYFNVTFNFVSQSQLVLLPGTNSIVVNSTPLSDSNEILDELHYFNFLIPKGLVWDMTIIPIDTPLTKEATEIGARIFRGHEFAAATDVVWLQWVCPDKTFSEQTLSDELKEFLQSRS